MRWMELKWFEKIVSFRYKNSFPQQSSPFRVSVFLDTSIGPNTNPLHQPFSHIEQRPPVFLRCMRIPTPNHRNVKFRIRISLSLRPDSKCMQHVCLHELWLESCHLREKHDQQISANHLNHDQHELLHYMGMECLDQQIATKILFKVNEIWWWDFSDNWKFIRWGGCEWYKPMQAFRGNLFLKRTGPVLVISRLCC